VVPPSNRAGSSIRSRRPSVRTASLAACQDTSRDSATLATGRCWQTTASSAHRTAARVSFPRGSAAAVVSSRQIVPHEKQAKRRPRTRSVVGRQPSGTCARRRACVPRATPSAPQAATERVAVGDTALQHRLVRRDFLTGDGEAVVVEEAERRKIGGGECPVGHVEVFRMASVGTSIIGRPRPRLRDRHAADSSGGRYTLIHDEPSTSSSPKMARTSPASGQRRTKQSTSGRRITASPAPATCQQKEQLPAVPRGAVLTPKIVLLSPKV